MQIVEVSQCRVQLVVVHFGKPSKLIFLEAECVRSVKYCHPRIVFESVLPVVLIEVGLRAIEIFFVTS